MVSSCAFLAQAAGIPGDWSFVTKQIGMFCYTGLTGASVPPYSFKPAPSWGRGSLLLPLCAPPPTLHIAVEQSRAMATDHHIYLLDSGR